MFHALISEVFYTMKFSGIMSEVTTVLSALGFSVCSCVVSWSYQQSFTLIAWIYCRSVILTYLLFKYYQIRPNLTEGRVWESCYFTLKGIQIIWYVIIAHLYTTLSEILVIYSFVPVMRHFLCEIWEFGIKWREIKVCGWY